MERTFIIKGAYHKQKGQAKATKCFPSLNDLISKATFSHNAYNDMKQKFQRIACVSIMRDLKGWKPTKRVQLKFEYGEPLDGHYRDYDNVTAGAHKIIIDALGSSKKQRWVTNTIIDDSPKYLAPCIDTFVYTDEEPYIKVTIVELDDIFFTPKVYAYAK